MSASDSPEVVLGRYQSVVEDALGERSVSGPDDEEAEIITHHLRRWARDAGHIAVDNGLALPLVLGLLDAGYTFDGLVEATIMHGSLPQIENQQLGTVILLVEGAKGWGVQIGLSAASSLPDGS